MKDAVQSALFFGCYSSNPPIFVANLVASTPTVGRDYFFPQRKLPLKTAV
jgi:hypothetical protein